MTDPMIRPRKRSITAGLSAAGALAMLSGCDAQPDNDQISREKYGAPTEVAAFNSLAECKSSGAFAADPQIKPPIRGLVSMGAYRFVGQGGDPVNTLEPLNAKAGIFGGLVVIETLFNYPGMGRLIFTAANDKDFPLLASSVLIVGIVFLVATLLADVAYSLLNPRIRYATAE